MSKLPVNNDYTFLQGGGEMGELIRAFDWHANILGPPDSWPVQLKQLTAIMINNPAQMLICWGPSFIQLYNDTFRPILGNNKHPQALGIPVYETYAEIWDTLEPLFTSVMAGTAVAFQDFKLNMNRNGYLEDVYFDFSYTPIYDEAGAINGVLVICTETTSKVVAAAELLALNKELAAINDELKAANDEQAVVNKKYKLAQDELQLAINAASLATYDYNPATNRFTGNDLLKSWFGLQPEDEIELSKAIASIIESDQPRVTAAMQRALTFESGGDYDIYYTIVNPTDPIPRIVRAKGQALFNDKQEPTRLSGVLQDVTEQRLDEQRKNDFIGMVSHELKTPLTSLTAIIQMANAKLKNSGDVFLAGAMEKAGIQTRRMGNMINGFLNISRLESGKIAIEKQSFHIGRLIEEMIKETELIATHVFKFTCSCDSNINADRDKVGSVITNLISNAVKYSPRESTIAITCQIDGDKVLVSVKDEGLGIDPADTKKIFDRYYRVETNSNQHISGFGIGLYLSAEIIQRHNGKIWVESQKGVGSTFYFSLPIN